MATTTNSTATPAQGGVVVTITNNLKVSVDIFDTFNPSTAAQTLPYKYTKLGTIAAGATGTVTTIRDLAQLQAMYTGTISELDNLYYYQFPIKFMSGTKSSYSTAPLAYTLTEADRMANVQAFQFHKFALANPDSALMTSVNAALKTGDSDTIDAFFAGTQNFQNCTNASWNAVLTWMQQVISAWQGTYYLYENPPSPTPADYVPKLMATLTIVSDAGNNAATLSICTTDANGNPAYATPPQNTTVMMAGDGTMTDANPGVQGDVTLSLTPIWKNVVQMTTQDGAALSYMVGSTMSGNILGTGVFSTQTPRQMPGQPADPNAQSLFDKLYGAISSGSATLVNLMLLYEFACKIFNSSREAKEAAKKAATSDADLKAKEAQIDKNAEAQIATKLNSPDATQTFNEVAVVNKPLTEAVEGVRAETMKQALNEELKNITDQVSKQINEGATPTAEFTAAYENVQKTFGDVTKLIDAGDLDGANAALKEATSTVNTAIQTNQSTMKDWETSALQKSAESFKTITESTANLDKALAENKSEIANEEASNAKAEEESEESVGEGVKA